MVNNRFVKALLCTLIACLIFTAGSVMAEPGQEQGQAGSPVVEASINHNQPSATRYEVQDGKISKEYTDYKDGSKEITSYVYLPDGSVVKSTETIASDQPAVPDNGVTMQGEPQDVYIYDQSIKDKISAVSTAYDLAESEYQRGVRTLAEKNAIQNELHFQADLARADYIIMNPNSAYAKIKLGGSSKSFPLSRNLSYNASSPMTGLDVLVIQRALQLNDLIELPDNLNYGVYGPEVEDAVRTYQSLSGNTPDGIVGSQTYASIFATTSNGVRNLWNLNQINIFRLKHALVQQASVYQIQANAGMPPCNSDKTSGICKEIYVPNGGRLGGAGYADIVDTNRRYVWEVKPDNGRWDENSSINRGGAAQLEKYIIASGNTQRSYFPLITGYAIAPFSVNWSATEYISVRAGRTVGPKAQFQSGMIYYKTNVKTKRQPVTAPSPKESRQKQTAPDAQTLAVSAGAVAAGYGAYRVGKFIIGVLLIPETGPLGVAIILAP
ncbi:peptidoglycan-binding protein [Cohnella faecalis]|uniref:Peptidoglycan-binding protein n=1 Tax=Cohnella faecalis TaxID=2315694 RepID=A0A398CUM0_9BACL|nr:peptidoglycan-binding domain-containing protein [Cohnella faecalis]RIE03557.1 peptidoglycan-binding protein [Cohnella faecalis]